MDICIPSLALLIDHLQNQTLIILLFHDSGGDVRIAFGWYRNHLPTMINVGWLWFNVTFANKGPEQCTENLK